MTVPVIQSVQYSNVLVYIFFDRAVTATLGQELNGFTFKDGGVPFVPTFSAIDDNLITAVLALPLSSDLEVSYVSGSGTVVEAVAPNDPAASFTDAVGVPVYTVPVLLRATAGEGSNDFIKVYFSQAVGSPSGDLVTGFTVEVDNVVLDLSAATATLNEDQTVLTIDTGTNFVYSDVVDVDYDSGVGDLRIWPVGTIADFTLNAVDNLSTDGLPNSSYPLSYVIKEPVTPCNGVVTATLGVSLNPIDIDIVNRYGPLVVFTGGTFGVTIQNPAGVVFTGGMVGVVDGTQLQASFVSTNVAWSVTAAQDWQAVVATKIGIELGKLRSIDQGIVLGDRTVTAV
jgi:hypothetical protein